MTAFNYTAIDAQGKQRKGLLEADNARQARQKLREQNLTPIAINAVSEKTKVSFSFLKRRPSIGINDLSLLTRQMATLLAAGLPVEEVLLAVSEQTEKPAIKAILLAVRARVLEGHTLATGLNDFPRAFPHLYRATVAAGEQSGHLDQILMRLADYIEKQNHIRQKIRQAMLYPSLMTVVSISIVIFLLISVVPKIAGVFTESKQSLPLLTRILLAISAAVGNYGWYILAVLLMMGYFVFRALKKPAVRNRWQLFLMRIPILGNALKEINSARFLRTFGILFAAGVPVLEAMRVAAELIQLISMRTAVETAIAQVREGGNISLALKKTRYFSPMSIHLMASGEASGQLTQMLEKAADNQDHHIELLIENTLTLFEPIMIVAMGSVVLFIVLAVLLPIFQLDVMVQ